VSGDLQASVTLAAFPDLSASFLEKPTGFARFAVEN
jgi:hypothetical protein